MQAGKLTALAVAVLATFAGDRAFAQGRLDYHQSPNYGARNVSPGFTPDPIRIEVTSGGSLDVSAMNLAPGCTGFATASPDFNFTLSAADAFLRVFMDAGNEDTTLIINRPDGSWVCADDVYGVNPSIDFANAAPGVYNVWVGSYRSNVRARGTLGITELRNVHPGQLSGVGSAPTPQPAAGGALDVSARPNFGSRTLAPGFVPDPSTVNVVSGGNLDASTLGLPAGCRGWVTRAPDFNLTLNGSSGSLRIYVDRTPRNADVTLIINRADGTWVCGDDSYGTLNPSVDLPNAGPGLYNVWVGSYREGTTVRGRLNVTELESRHP